MENARINLPHPSLEYYRLGQQICQIGCSKLVEAEHFYAKILTIFKNSQYIVSESSPPAIAGESLQHFTFALNETEKLLECNSAAKPAASVTWTKNGEDIPKNMIILNESGTSVIMIRRITHDSAAEYKCIAKNIVGETTKIIRVFVEGNN